MATRYVTEILGEINNDPTNITGVIQRYPVIKDLLQYAFDPTKKFLLPEGTPAFEPDPAPDLGMSEMNLYSVIRKLYVFCRADLTPEKRSQMFVQLLEQVHVTEASLMVAVKDQLLQTLYPSITPALLEGAGIIPTQPKVSHATPVTKQPRGKGGRFIRKIAK